VHFGRHILRRRFMQRASIVPRCARIGMLFAISLSIAGCAEQSARESASARSDSGGSSLHYGKAIRPMAPSVAKSALAPPAGGGMGAMMGGALADGSLPHLTNKLKREQKSQEAAAAPAEPNTEAYDKIVDNPFHRSVSEPLSTFSIDVDTA